MADYDVAVIGGGPAGYSAALKAAELGAKVALIEAEKPGGACVNHSCIPTSILVDSAIRHAEAQELGVLGVFSVGSEFNWARASARREPLIGKITTGISAALRMRKVKLVPGRARFSSPNALAVRAAAGETSLTADAFIIATGTRWEPPEIPGLPADRYLTPDAVQALPVLPASAAIIADSPCDVPFGAEYAALLAMAGVQVSLVTSQARIATGLDDTVHSAFAAGLRDLGVALHEGTHATTYRDGALELASDARLNADIVVAADPRIPFTASLGLDSAGVTATPAIAVDRSCRTNVAHIFAAGDVAGGAMLTNIAQHMGEVAGENAAGGSASVRGRGIPRIVHGLPSAGWAGMTEEAARQAGHDVISGSFDLGFNAKAITLGGREGIVKVVADRQLGELLGVHAVGPGIEELLGAAAALMQAEVSVFDLAATVAWHPSMSEGLVEAAKRAVATT